MRIVTIDFEASCLPRHGRSFPIEVGIAHTDGRARSWLIQPVPEWSEWGWTEEAQSLHGITRQQLDRDGLPIAQVLAELTEAVAGWRVFADSHLDAGWLDTLANAARTPRPFRIEHIEALVDRFGATPEDIAAAQSCLAGETFVRHRAGDDARWLARFVITLANVAGRRVHEVEAPQFGWAPPSGAEIRYGAGYAAAA
ncbi:MAG: hypothetical protein U9R73_08940 [Pseudomonadota bacterium]|nr:hypothetical protein [Pseudomonadota bacterium]